jgi:hypothetical protein
MDPLNNPSTGIAAGVAESGGLLANWKGWVGLVSAIVGIVLLIVGNQTNVANDTVKQNYNLGGSIFFIAGAAFIFGNFSGFKNTRAYFEGSETRKIWGTILIVLMTTIAIFVALFYNYASSETVSFSTAILVVLIVVIIFVVLFRFSGKVPIANLISRSLLILFYFMPYAFFTFGIVTDIITRQLQFSGASFTGLTAVLFNYAISLLFTNGVAPTVQKPLCEIPGLAFLPSILAPQPMVATLSTLAYIATYISRSKPGYGYAVAAEYRWPAWALFFGVFGLQYGVLASTGCLQPKEGIVYPFEAEWYPKISPLVAMAGSLLYGGIMGAVGFGVLGLEGREDTTGATGAGGSPALGATVTASLTPTLGTCAAGSSDGEFICESFENGKLKRRVMTE